MREVNQQRKVDRKNPIKINAFESQNLNYPFHYHSNQYEMTLVLGGRGIRVVGDNVSEFDENDLVLVGKGIPHTWISTQSGDQSSKSNFQVIAVHFNTYIFGDELLNRSEFIHIRNLLTLSDKGLSFGKDITRNILEKFFQFTLEPDFNTYINIMEILNGLAESGDYKTLCSDNYSYKGRPDESNKFEAIFNYIQSNYLSKIKITDVATLAGMNDSAFSHYFKKRTSYSFTDFINLLRLNHAAKQIVYQHKNIADICFDSGFNNLSNFNRMFKKWKGDTPLQYRKKQVHIEVQENRSEGI
jgi:AraC-like DNA-binding protein